MAQVPETELNMFGGVTGASAVSIQEVVKHVVGDPGDTPRTFDKILTKVKASADIDDFHPSYKPDGLANTESTFNFRLFPSSIPLILHCGDREEITITLC